MRRLRKVARYLVALARLVGRLVWELMRYLGQTVGAGTAQLVGVAALIALVPFLLLALGIYLRVALVALVVCALFGVGFARRRS